ncbi:SPFH domain-containing protein [Dysgonomonas sp. 216]|uniref:SPFH domain-containing protein n=1 Tax=Dysgonomonas sp. 216 TaxID=2302934 RepID=UPI0013D8DD27|nr:SPFH domain-containing protein [Dysgonomonas sp. 216]NDW19746.1 SPFH domain-containing protein [Dysgonomonas sp. 216]
MKKFMYLIVALFACVSLTSCHFVSPDADEEAVLTHKPWFFGHGGVDEKPVKTGLSWCWGSTSSDYFKIVPIKYPEPLDDIISNENTPLDFNTMITLKIKEGKSPVLLKNYGINWYDNNIKENYTNLTRHYVSQYSPFDLTSNREVIAHIDSCVKSDMVRYIDKLSLDKEFPIIVENVITGRAIPNNAQLTEMNNTAAQIQAKQTQERRKEMEDAREQAERQRAVSDKAYQREMGLTAEQFISLKAWDIIEKKEDANIDVLFNADNTNRMWNIK